MVYVYGLNEIHKAFYVQKETNHLDLGVTHPSFMAPASGTWHVVITLQLHNILSEKRGCW